MHDPKIILPFSYTDEQVEKSALDTVETFCKETGHHKGVMIAVNLHRPHMIMVGHRIDGDADGVALLNAIVSKIVAGNIKFMTSKG